ncbi:unnamed protein product [Durusdinium trenchii]
MFAWCVLSPLFLVPAVASWVSASTGEIVEETSSLVRVGTEHGILVSREGLTAVRWDEAVPKQPALRAAIQAAEEARKTLRAPCPSTEPTSRQSSCSSWCRQVTSNGPSTKARVEGTCAYGLQCLCEAGPDVYASCSMRCQATEATTTTTTPVKSEAVTNSRLLFYDTRFSVDFMTQVEVFFVALELVRRLNRLVEESCRKGTRGSECQPWTLVLPPWCWLPRWYGFEGGAGTRWSELFNLEALKSAGVPFQEYTGSAVDLGVVPVAGRKVQHLKDGWGDFFGFTKEMKVCDTHGQQAPQAGSKRGSVVYAGYCDSDIIVSSLKCGVLSGSFKSVLDLLESAGQRSSILLKHLDALQLHSSDGPFATQFHSALSPSKALQDSARRFTDVALGSLPYLAVHLHRSVVHKEATPSAAAAAARINRLLKKRKLEQVYVAGDVLEGFRTELRSMVKEALYFFSPDDGADRLPLRGQEELVELLLAAKAEYFIGTSGSSFSAAVRRQRKSAGLPAKTSEEVFCGNLTETEAARKCVE